MPQRKSKDRLRTSPSGRELSIDPAVASPESHSPLGSASAMPATPGLEQRRKLKKDSSIYGLQTPQDIIRRPDFSLDTDVPTVLAKSGQTSAKGFFDLSARDRSNFLLLVFLYFLQGVPMGLAHGSVPFLLKSHLNYSQIGIYTLATYPFSLKLLWSPVVDAVWNPVIGRRMSWILPVQLLSGIGMIWLGAHIEAMISSAGGDGNAGVWRITAWWFALVASCATQDIAVDGWAITLLAPDNLLYASSAQTVGITAGSFLSFTVFLAFNSKDFANRWLRSTPLDTGVLTLGGYLTFWGWAYMLATVGLAFFKREDKTKVKEGVLQVYRAMGSILKLKSIQTIVIIHCIAKIGFKANESVTNLKLLDKGFHQEDLALIALIDFPVEICLGYYAGKWSEDFGAIPLWCWAFVGRLVAAAFAQIVVLMYPAQGIGTGYLLLIIVEHVFSTFMGTVMFVAICAFHASIADPLIGGTYMTLLATVSNLGDTFPKIFVLKLVDTFTVTTCTPPMSTPQDLKRPLILEPFSCALEAEKQRCIEGGGTCNITTDGFYIVNVMCIIFGLVTFYGYIKPAALRLGQLPMTAWRVETSKHAR